MLSQNLLSCIQVADDLTNDVATVMSSGGLIEEVLALASDYALIKTINFPAAKAELATFATDTEDRKAAEQAFLAGLKLPNAEIQARITSGVSVLDQALVLVEGAVAYVKQGEALVIQAKALFAPLKVA